MKRIYEKNLWMKWQPELYISRFRGLPVCVPSYAIEAIIWSKNRDHIYLYISYMNMNIYIYIKVWDN